jgi:hypothetical protein
MTIVEGGPTPTLPRGTAEGAAAGERDLDVHERLERTVRLLERRGYALAPDRLGEICLGGPLDEARVRAAVETGGRLQIREGLVVTPELAPAAPAIARRAGSHRDHADRCWPLTVRFVRTLVRLSPFILSVSVAGSLASGGFAAADDVDLNLIVEDGRRHLAYVAVNVLGLLHGLRHRRKPVDALTRRPLAPRFMTANLILERSECFPLARQDVDMAYEFLASRPVYGAALWYEVVATNGGLTAHFPQLERRSVVGALRDRPWLPGWLFPAALDGPAERVGGAGWRYMQWTRRHSPEALARVAFVRQTMRPYTLFDHP